MSEVKEERKEVRDAFNHAIEAAQKVENIQGFIILVSGEVEFKEGDKSFQKGVNACGGSMFILSNLYKNIDPKIVETAKLFNDLNKLIGDLVKHETIKDDSNSDDSRQTNKD